MKVFTAHYNGNKTVTIEKPDGSSAVWTVDKNDGRYTYIHRWPSSSSHDAFNLGASLGFSGKSYVFDGRKIIYRGTVAHEPELYAY